VIDRGTIYMIERGTINVIDRSTIDENEVFILYILDHELVTASNF
jgi:hypothetical protein